MREREQSWGLHCDALLPTLWVCSCLRPPPAGQAHRPALAARLAGRVGTLRLCSVVTAVRASLFSAPCNVTKQAASRNRNGTRMIPTYRNIILLLVGTFLVYEYGNATTFCDGLAVHFIPNLPAGIPNERLSLLADPLPEEASR